MCNPGAQHDRRARLQHYNSQLPLTLAMAVFVPAFTSVVCSYSYFAKGSSDPGRLFSRIDLMALDIKKRITMQPDEWIVEPQTYEETLEGQQKKEAYFDQSDRKCTFLKREAVTQFEKGSRINLMLCVECRDSV